ncbi:non-specific lipid-transfer protein 13-like isoform X2 [Ricinus communis]|nr:non-specific lipid-transfer protein 13-like isoform X2 [Ricinus communis]
MARFVSYLILILLMSSELIKITSVTSVCELVFQYFPDCMDFLSGKYYKPSKRCCLHIFKLNLIARHGIGPKWICWCIELMVTGWPMNATRIQELPVKCHTRLSFPISERMDCNK